MHCKPCGQRLTANSIQPISKPCNSAVCRPANKFIFSECAKIYRMQKKVCFIGFPMFRVDLLCCYSITSHSRKSMTSFSRVMAYLAVGCKYYDIDWRWNLKICKSVFLESPSPTNINRKISQFTGSEAFGQHDKPQLEMSSTKRRIHDPIYM